MLCVTTTKRNPTCSCSVLVSIETVPRILTKFRENVIETVQFMCIFIYCGKLKETYPAIFSKILILGNHWTLMKCQLEFCLDRFSRKRISRFLRIFESKLFEMWNLFVLFFELISWKTWVQRNFENWGFLAWMSTHMLTLSISFLRNYSGNCDKTLGLRFQQYNVCFY